VFAVLVVVATAATALFAKSAFANVTGSALGWVFVVLLLVSLVFGRVSMNGGKDLPAWYAISLSAVSLVGIWAASIFPELVPTLGPGPALTITNSASSQLTLTVMLIIAAIGVPLVLFYVYLVYKIFAGKIKLDGEGY
jgi:cytochrome d ubiquinol oxidase subunit II